MVPDAVAWRRWLTANHAQPTGVFLCLAKKGVTKPTRLVYAEALAEAVSFGWIDGQLKSRDDKTYRVRFTPRRLQSIWSKRNRDLAEQLIKEGRMQAAGIAQVERAKADGRWARAYGGQNEMEVPGDLAAALMKNPEAKAMFTALTKVNRFAILFRIHAAKRPETRERRIKKFVEMLARGETMYPQRNKVAQSAR